MLKFSKPLLLSCALLIVSSQLFAVETENHGIRVLPAKAKPTIDGKFDDWDLSGGIFACGEVEYLRNQYSVWFHAMYDNDNIYLLARWADPTPLNNPGTVGGHGFNGDCLQVRFIMFPDTDDKCATWWTLWRDIKGVQVADRASPGPVNGFKENPLENLANADEAGFKQAFTVNDDKQGYVQEVAIPWKLLSVSGKMPAVGSKFRLTIEPNFTAGKFGRITIKDIFDDKIAAPDRVFTFRAYQHWGWATMVDKNNVEPQAVRLADRRTFPVTLKGNALEVDWNGLIKKFEWPGFAPITFETPSSGYVSLNILNKDGVVVRHLLNCDQREKGPHTVKWDGLSDATFRTPGEPVPAGEYTWQAIEHPGAKVTFRGFASCGGRAPWIGGPEHFWLGDHGVPTAVIANGDQVCLACNGAEGGRHLVVTDLDGKCVWSLQNTSGGWDPEYIAADGDFIFVLHPTDASVNASSVVLSRVDCKTQAYGVWEGRKSHALTLGDLFGDTLPVVAFSGIAARDGKIYLTSSDPKIRIEDIGDWKEIIKFLRSDNPLSAKINAQLGSDITKHFDNYLAGKKDAQKILEGTARTAFVQKFLHTCADLIQSEDARPSENVSYVARACANRKALEEAFNGAIKPMKEGSFFVLDGASGKVLKTFALPRGTALHAISKDCVLAISNANTVVAINPETGVAKNLITDVKNARGLCSDKDGNIYVSVCEPDMQVRVFNAQGAQIKTIGKKGGHPQVGAWQPDGMYQPAGIAIDSKNQLWVMERYAHPKRVSVWNLADGSLVREHFGPTHYGASGAAINPRDPNIMVGEGCEWKLDPQTGKSACLGAYSTRYHEYAAYREGSNGKLYLFTADVRYGIGAINIWERLGDANYKLRASVHNDRGSTDNNTPGATQIWVDANGDGKEQPEEIENYDGGLYFTGSNGWSLNLGPDMTLYGHDWKDKRLKALTPDGFTADGAPKFSFKTMKTMPEEMSNGYQRNGSCAVPSADNKRILVNLAVKNHPAGFLWHCFDLQTNKLLWTYPNPYFQVHGSHKAPAPEPGLFRGAYGPVGAVSMSSAAGNVWFINANLGEWYTINSDGFFLSRVFSGNVFEWAWPSEPTPGLDLSRLPAGSGGEDFGGSVTQGKDGKIYVQAGKYGIWNTELTGFEQAAKIGSGKMTLSEADTRTALNMREMALQSAAAARKLTIKKAAVSFTGKFQEDFKNCEIADYQKSEDARVRTALAHDDTTLYVGWEVRDSSPWINGAKDIAQMYVGGDTVDLQLGADASANPKRDKAVAGDLRLSIGNFGGKPTAVLYKFVSSEKKPRLFDSGVVKGYQVDWVDVLADAKVEVKTTKEGYVLEAAVPLAALGLKLSPGIALRGDVGATHADAGGVRTRLRTYWANQQTGLVDDVVFELQPAPQNWGEFIFE